MTISKTVPQYNTQSSLPAVFDGYLDKRVWIASKLEWVSVEGLEKLKKTPINIWTGGKASCSDPETWATFNEAEAYCLTHKDHLLAIALSPDIGLVCIDLDDVGNGDVLTREAQRIIAGLDSYTEQSASGNGVHVFVEGKKPGVLCRKGNVEVYDKAKFITVTGDVVLGHIAIEDRQAAIERLYSEIFGADEVVTAAWTLSPRMTDKELLDKCRKAKNSDKFVRLFDGGDAGEYSGDESAADMALASMIAFYTQDEKQIERIMRQSALAREKWDNHATYLVDLTIGKALSSLTNTYHSWEARLEQTARQRLKQSNPCEGFALDPFPESLQEHVITATVGCEAHPIMTLSAAIGTASSYASRCFVNYFGKLYPNTYQLNLRASGGGKTTSLNRGADPALQREKQLASELKEQMQIANKTKDTEAAEIRADALKERAKRSRVLAQRTTCQRLLTDLALGHRGVVFISEFGPWLSEMEKQYNAGMKGLLTEIYDCPEYFEVRLQRNVDKPEILTNPFFGLVAVCTPDWLEGEISNTDVLKGFLARFLIFWIKDPSGKPQALPGKKWNPPEAFRAALEEAEKQEGEYWLSEEAKQAFCAIHDQLWESLLGDFPEQEQRTLIEPFLRRWSPSIIKVALTLHLLEDPTNRDISATAVKAAAYYVGFAVNSTLDLLRSGLLDSPFHRDCQKIIDFVTQRGGKVTWAQISSSKKLDGSRRYEEVVNFLVDGGELGMKEGATKKENVYFLLDRTKTQKPKQQQVEKVEKG